MSTSEATKTSEESKSAFAEALNKELESTGVVTPLLGALTKSVDNSRKLIDQGHSLAKQGPVYAMVFLSAALVAFAISFAEFHSSDSADFIAGLVIASVLLIVAGILQLINNIAESRAAAQQVSALSSANERIVKYAIEQNAAIAARRQEELVSSPHTSNLGVGRAGRRRATVACCRGRAVRLPRPQPAGIRGATPLAMALVDPAQPACEQSGPGHIPPPESVTWAAKQAAIPNRNEAKGP